MALTSSPMKKIRHGIDELERLATAFQLTGNKEVSNKIFDIATKIREGANTINTQLRDMWD